MEHAAGNKNYILGVDSTVVRNGKYSGTIEHKAGTKTNFEALSYYIPWDYEGKKITLSGYVKTENVTNGYAGLWMRGIPAGEFDYMNDRGVTGTTDWTKCEITFNVNPSFVGQIVIGGILIGNGKMWVDDLKLTIDGVEIEKIEKKTYRAK